MSFDLTQKIKVVNPTSNIDELYGPYTSVANALTGVPVVLRQLGRTVGIIEGGTIKEYWFENGITDSDLVEKGEGGGTDTLESVMNRGNYAPKDIEFKSVNGHPVVLGFAKTSLALYFTSSYSPLSTGLANTVFGMNTGSSLTSGSRVTAVGHYALAANTSGGYNDAFGAFSLRQNTTGSNNVAIGSYALASSTTGQWNSALGTASLTKNTTGGRNVAVGTSLYWNTVGNRNTAIGFNAGYAAVSGINNTYIGNSAAYDNGVGSYNVAIGNEVLAKSAGGYTNAGSTISMNRNVFIGSVIKGDDGLNDTLAIDNKGEVATLPIDALLYGGFSVANRFLNIGGKLSVTPAHMPNATTAETKKVVWNPITGVFAVKDDTSGGTTVEANKQRFTGDTISAKTLTQTPKTNSISVILNGLELDEQGGDYTVSGTTVTLANEPLITDVIVIKYLY